MNEYNEDNLIEKPAIELFKQLGYKHKNCFNEQYGLFSELGRETTSDVVLRKRLKDALVRLNPDLSNETIDMAMKELTRDRSTLNPAKANKEIYEILNLRKFVLVGIFNLNNIKL